MTEPEPSADPEPAPSPPPCEQIRKEAQDRPKSLRLLPRITADAVRNISARIAHRARRIILHLPEHWPWQTAWTTLFTAVHGPPARA